jgi:cyclomaltodextrinase
MEKWFKDSFIYHVYPLGLCGAPFKNNEKKDVKRIEQLFGLIDYWKELNINAIYFGPVFEAESHGYDTVDYYNIDSRLGDNLIFTELSNELHDNGIRIVLDGVFNHVSREFFAFRDVLINKEKSEYWGWFHLDFNKKSPLGDPFSYQCWEGHNNLVNLNLKNPEVENYLFNAVRKWIKEFNISGIRLDVAYALDQDFIRKLKTVCLAEKSDFWLMGEFIHGDHQKMIAPEKLDSVTNYECYKGLYSSHNDHNYFEIAYSLNRLFGKEGIYKDKHLYNFIDNHDVERAGSILNNKAHIFPLNVLLMTIPGIPSIYYGSEFGIKGKKKADGDRSLRPALSNREILSLKNESDLFKNLKKMGKIRKENSTLRNGDYQQMYINHEQFAFSRSDENGYYLNMVNMSEGVAEVPLKEVTNYGTYVDLLNPGESFKIDQKNNKIPVYPNWGRILKLVG